MPTPKILALAQANETVPTRDTFLSSLVDVEGLEPATLNLYGTDPTTDEPIEDVEPIASANFVHIQQVQLPQEERVQMHLSADDEGKLITYGRQTRMYAVAGFLVDSNRSDGHVVTQWDNMYENYFRLTACLKVRRIARLRWRLSSIYGYLLSNVKGIESTQPNVCMVNFTFLSAFEVDYMRRRPVMDLGEGVSVEGAASYESIATLGLVPSLSILEAAAGAQTAVGNALDASAKARRGAAKVFFGLV